MPDLRIIPIVQTRSAIETLRGMRAGQEVRFEVPVLVSAQERDDIAHEIFNAAFICEQLARGLSTPAISVESHPTQPNHDLVVLEGRLADSEALLQFINEWSETLDEDELGEPFDAAAEGESLLEQLEAGGAVTECRWGELVAWYREVRAF